MVFTKPVEDFIFVGSFVVPLVVSSVDGLVVTIGFADGANVFGRIEELLVIGGRVKPMAR